MNEMKVSCPHCGQHISYTEAWSGHQLNCPTCQGSMTIPGTVPLTILPPPKCSPNASAPGRNADTTAAPDRTAGVEPVAAPRSKLAIASMVSSLVLCLAPLSSIAGVICGHLARRELRGNPALRGSGFATTGLVVGYSAGIVAVGLLTLFFILPGALILIAPSLITAAASTPGESAILTNWPTTTSRPENEPVSTRPADGKARPQSRGDVTSDLPAMKNIPQPAKPVTGRIGDHSFTCETATLKNGWLTFRQGKDFFADAEVQVMLFSANAAPEGKTIVVDPSSRFGNPHLHFKWKDPSGGRQMGMAMNGYKMKLQMGKSENGVVPGSIELEFKGDKTISIKGDFAAVTK